MKSCIALMSLCLTINSFSQTINPEYATPNLVNFIASSGELLKNYNEKELENVASITTNYWDTSKLKLKYDTEIEFPIQLQFKDSNYAAPISRNKVVTSRYGWRWGRAHNGIDIDLVTGDSLFAMFDGIIRFANYSSGHGRSVVVRHFNGLETVYAHLSRYGVKENDTVKAGDYLGKGGASGNAQGSHLHLEMSYQGIPINPEYLLDFTDSNKIQSKEIWITKNWTQPEFHSSKRQSKLEILTTKTEALESINKPKKVYFVKRGDTLSRIASRNFMSISAICKLNNIRRNATLRIGQKLII